jgi:hypothetical protein
MYVRIRRLKLILYVWFFSCRTVVLKGRMSSIRVENVKCKQREEDIVRMSGPGE